MNPALVLVALLAGASAPDAEIQQAAEAMTPALVELRRDIHRNPELGNRELRTGGRVAERLRALGLEVCHPVAKTGVVAVLRGGRPGVVVALRADLDALPIQERNDVPYKSHQVGWSVGPIFASSDAFAIDVPGLYVKLGVRNEARGITASIHTEDFDIDEGVLPLGVRAMATLVWDYLARTRQ